MYYKEPSDRKQLLSPSSISIIFTIININVGLATILIRRYNSNRHYSEGSQNVSHATTGRFDDPPNRPVPGFA